MVTVAVRGSSVNRLLSPSTPGSRETRNDSVSSIASSSTMSTGKHAPLAHAGNLRFAVGSMMKSCPCTEKERERERVIE